jgi:hypothetical protein
MHPGIERREGKAFGELAANLACLERLRLLLTQLFTG